MSEPIQLEWEPAEWPEKRRMYDGRQRSVPLRGMAEVSKGLAVGDVVRVRIPPTVVPQVLAAKLHSACQRGRIVTRQQGGYIYVRRVQ